MEFDWSASGPDDGQQQPQPAALPSRREARMAALTRPTKAAPAAAAATVAPAPRAVATAARTAHVPTKRPLRRRILPKFLSIGAMLGAGALLIASSVPANALMTTNADAMAPIAHVRAQSLATVDTAAIAQTSARDGYTVVSVAQKVALRFTSTNWAYTNDPNGTIQWPYPAQVPISTGFGPRQVAGCSFCSTYHEGVDFDPGMGAPIQAIADGVVTDVVLSHAALGNHVVIDHVINGQHIQSLYGHMMDGSIKVVVGQTVKVTDIVGLTGSTGASTGAHLHLEIHVNNVPIDPFAWLKANAN